MSGGGERGDWDGREELHFHGGQGVLNATGTRLELVARDIAFWQIYIFHVDTNK